MADGRPAFAWWNEIQMLRHQAAEKDQALFRFREMQVVLRIAQVLSPDSLDVLIRIKPRLDVRPDDLWQHPEKYAEIVRNGGSNAHQISQM